MNIAMIGLSDSRFKRLGAWDNEKLHVRVYRPGAQLDEAIGAEGADAFVLCGGFASLAELCDAAECCLRLRPGAALAVWLEAEDGLLDRRDPLFRYCMSQGIQYWDADSGPASWAELSARLKGTNLAVPRMRKGHLAVFQGMTPNIGTTVAAFGTAVRLALETDRRIAFVCLNLKSSKLHHYIGVDKPEAALDDIRAELKSGSLTAQGLRNRLHVPAEAGGLAVLFGNLLREQAEYYAVEDIELLLGLCRELFDLTVIEVSAYWDNAAVFAAMLEADSRILVCSDRLASFQEDYCRGVLPMLEALQLERTDFDLVVKRTAAASGYGVHDIRRQTGLNVIGTIRHHTQVESMADEGRLHELLSRPHPIANELQGLAGVLMHTAGLGRRSGVRPAPARWRRMLLPILGR
jgi:hypothetical protein